MWRKLSSNNQRAQWPLFTPQILFKISPGKHGHTGTNCGHNRIKHESICGIKFIFHHEAYSIAEVLLCYSGYDNASTVKPMSKDQPRSSQKLTFLHNWPFIRRVIYSVTGFSDIGIYSYDDRYSDVAFNMRMNVYFTVCEGVMLYHRPRAIHSRQKEARVYLKLL